VEPNYNQIGPGFWGFLATFIMALAIIVIYWSLTKHLRKIRRDTERQREAPTQKASRAEDDESGGDVVARESGDGE
jgi:hypothetical protein